MDFVSIDSLREHGFEGFLTVAELAERYREIPDKMGVYLVVTPDGFKPQYVERGTGGFFKSLIQNYRDRFHALAIRRTKS